KQFHTSTRADGGFTIGPVDASDVLVFSYVGYGVQEIRVGELADIQVHLLPEQHTMDEVVIVGYGSQSKRKVSTAISKVSATDINHLPVTNAAGALNGLAAGVQVQSGAGDTPGEVPTIRIRGVGSLGAANTP